MKVRGRGSSWLVSRTGGSLVSLLNVTNLSVLNRNTYLNSYSPI